MENFGELELLEKLDNNVELTEDEIIDFMWHCGTTVDTIAGECDRCTQSMQTVKLVCKRFFLISWKRGLTERQENEFYYQPVEVYPQEKLVQITEWVPMYNGGDV